MFLTTDWKLLADLRHENPTAKQASLDILIRRYWKPVYHFLKGSGQEDESAKDLTQSFFADWIEKDGFDQADECKGVCCGTGF